MSRFYRRQRVGLLRTSRAIKLIKTE